MFSSAFPSATDKCAGLRCTRYKKYFRWLSQDAFKKVSVLVGRLNLQSACCCSSQVLGSGAAPSRKRGCQEVRD